MSNWLFDEEPTKAPVNPGNEGWQEIAAFAIAVLIATALRMGLSWCFKKLFEGMEKLFKKISEAQKEIQAHKPQEVDEGAKQLAAAIGKYSGKWAKIGTSHHRAMLKKLTPTKTHDILDRAPNQDLAHFETFVAILVLAQQTNPDTLQKALKSPAFGKAPLTVAFAVDSKIAFGSLWRWTDPAISKRSTQMWKEWSELNNEGYHLHEQLLSKINDLPAFEKKVLELDNAIDVLENKADAFETKYEKCLHEYHDISIDVDVKHHTRVEGYSAEAVALVSQILTGDQQTKLIQLERHHAELLKRGLDQFEFDGTDTIDEMSDKVSKEAAAIIENLYAVSYGIVYVGWSVDYPYFGVAKEINGANVYLVKQYQYIMHTIDKLVGAASTFGLEYFNDTPEELEAQRGNELAAGWTPLVDDDDSAMPIVKPGTEALATIATIGIVLAGVYHWSKKYKDLKIRHELKADTETHLRMLGKLDPNGGLNINKFPLLNRDYLSDLTDVFTKMVDLGDDTTDLYSHVVFKASCGYKVSTDHQHKLEELDHSIQTARLRFNALETPKGECSVHDALQSANALQALLKLVAKIQYRFEGFDTQADTDSTTAREIEECDDDSKTAIGQALALYQDYSKLFMQMANDLTAKLQSMFKEIDRLAGKTKPGTEDMTDTTPAVVETAEQEPVWTEQDTTDGWCDFDTYVDPDPAIEMGSDEGVVAADDLQAIAGLESYCDLIQKTGMSRDIYVTCESLAPGILSAVNQRHLTQAPSRTGKTIALEALQSHITALRTPKPTQVAVAVADAVVDVRMATQAYRPSRASWVLPGMESIDHIRNSKLFSRLTEAVRYMRESKDYTARNFKQSGFNDAIFEETGMRIQVELDPDTSPNAYVYIPEININNSIMQEWTRNWTTNDSLLDLKKALGRTTEALLDRSTSKVGGVLSNLLIKSCITKGLMTAKEFTCEEIAAVMMHECGHVFTFFERMLDIMSMNYAISAVTSRLLNTEDKKLRMNLIHEFDAAFGVTIPDVELLAETKKGETIATVLISETMRSRRNAEGDMIYSQRGFEFSSDQFATRHGAGAHLVTALDKMMRKYGNDSSYSCWAMHIIKQTGVFLLSISGILAGLFIMPIYSIILIALLFISRPLDKTYDEIPARFARVRREMIDGLKDQTLPAELRRGILSELETVSNIIDKLEYKRGWLEAVWAHIIPSGRKATTSQELQQLLERLGNNDLWIAAAKYKLLSEDLKNA